MPAIITVSYPTDVDANATFDLDYYLKKHMPLVQSKWGPHGLKSWTVVKLEHGPYLVQAALHWDSVAQFKKAVEAEGAVIFGDLPNFTNKTPVQGFGELVGQS